MSRKSSEMVPFQSMTYPLLPWKEIMDLSRDALGVPLAQNETVNPTMSTVTRLSQALLELVTGVPRQEVAETIAGVLDGAENPELFKEALPQLVLLREMERLVSASLGDFGLNDLIQPVPNRLQRFLSAVMNFGRFREDLLRQHAEHTQELTDLIEEQQTCITKTQQLQAQIKSIRERQSKDAPERAKIEEDIARLEMEIRSLASQRIELEQRVDDLKKKADTMRKLFDAMTYETMNLNRETEEIKSRMVASPERIQNDLKTDMKRLEQSKVELDGYVEDERAIKFKTDNLKTAQAIANTVVTQLTELEGQASRAKEAEEEQRARKAAIDSHAYTVRELQQREQEAQREADLAEDRYKRQSQQRFAKLEAAKQKLLQAERERDQHDRSLDDANRRAARAKAQVAAARIDYAQIKTLGDERLAESQALLESFLTTFETYAKGVEEAASEVKRAAEEVAAM